MIIWGSFVNKINEVKSNKFQNQDTRVCFEKFLILIFYYVEQEGEIEAWRVLHGARDIAAWMRVLHENH